MKNTSSTRTVGLDLGDRKHAICVLDADAKILKEESITNTRDSLTALSRKHPGALLVRRHREDKSSADRLVALAARLGI